MAYEYQEFPKWKYHRDHKAKVVQNAEEEAALGSGWYDTPDFRNFKEVVVEVVEKVEMPRARRPKFVDAPNSDEQL